MRALLLVDHGSRVAAANAQLIAIAERVRARAPGLRVAHAHMELAAPDLATAIGALAAEGVRQLVVVPFFLSPGRHVARDIPRLVADACEAYPSLEVRVASCLGDHDLLAELVLLRAAEAELEE